MNRIIKQLSLIGLFMLGASIAASAQSSQQYRADIPFNFDIEGKHYAAGQYEVGSLSQVSSHGGISIRNLETGRARVLGLTSQTGSDSREGLGRLTFLKVDGLYTLSQILTPTFKMKMNAGKVRGGELAKGVSGSEIVAVDLKK